MDVWVRRNCSVGRVGRGFDGVRGDSDSGLALQGGTERAFASVEGSLASSGLRTGLAYSRVVGLTAGESVTLGVAGVDPELRSLRRPNWKNEC